MKLILILLLLFVSCSKKVQQPDDDYVLIEFASKLEEDNQKLYPAQEQNK